MSNKAASNIFAEAQKLEQEQKVAASLPVTIEPLNPNSREIPQEAQHTQKNTQKDTQISNIPNGLPSNLPDAQTIEEVSFRLRKVPKIRVNADIPVQWKERLNERAYQLKVGKYELLVYIIAEFLGEV